MEHYKKLQKKGGNIYIDSLTYEEFMLLGDMELSRRFSELEEKSEKDKLHRMHEYELEYADESQGTDDGNGNGGTTGNAVKHSAKVKPEWEDTITNRMLHWSYTPEQKEELKKAVAEGVPKATILTYFYPEVSAEKMRTYRNK